MAAEGIGALGISLPAFLFQALNFLVLLALLRIFAYPAIIRALEGRKRAIDGQLKNAAELERKLAQASQDATAMLDASHQQARKVLSDATDRADDIVNAAFEKAQQEADVLVSAARAKITQDVTQAREELRAETAKLVIAATERVLAEKITKKEDLRIIERSLL